MPAILEIITPYGARYLIHEGGRIQRTDMEFAPSDTWRMLGLQHVQRREFIPFADIPARLPALQLTYKNGNPCYTVRDLDHGTTRPWGNTKYHGVRFCRVVRI